MREYKLSIITPRGKILEQNATSLIAPGIEGQFGILAGHRHMVAQLKEGVLQIKGAQPDAFYAINSGVLEVNEERNVIILADRAIQAKSLEEAKNKCIHFREHASQL